MKETPAVHFYTDSRLHELLFLSKKDIFNALLLHLLINRKYSQARASALVYSTSAGLGVLTWPAPEALYHFFGIEITGLAWFKTACWVIKWIHTTFPSHTEYRQLTWGTKTKKVFKVNSSVEKLLIYSSGLKLTSLQRTINVARGPFLSRLHLFPGEKSAV